MRVTRLEVFGFKSFLERFVLDFNKNMIGIVGPNGCGKSNVVDALRWVLGETQAKQLRGGSFEDLIFNGSETKRPLGMAEVSLTIQPDSDWQKRITESTNLTTENDEIEGSEEISADLGNPDNSETTNNSELEGQNNLSEIKDDKISLLNKKILEIPGIFDVAEMQFTRRLYRSGESEYFINKVPCRLKDLQEVYRLIGLGARGLSIVQQGQIGQFISKKPLERRELIEEAAGISGFRSKMEAAGRRLDKTNDNLARLSDIVIEVEKQVKSLKRQAKKAEARKELKDSLYQADKELFELKTSRLVVNLANDETENQKLTDKINECESSLEEKEASILEIESKLNETETNILSLRREKDEHSRKLMEQENRLQNIRLKLASLESESNHTSEKINDGKNSRELISAEIESLQEKLSEINLEIEQNKNDISSKEAALTKIIEENKQKIELFYNNSGNVKDDDLDSELSILKNRINEIQNLISEKELLISENNSLHDDLKKASSDLKNTEKSKLELERKRTKVSSEIEAIEKQIQSFSEHALEVSSKNADESSVKSARVLLSLLDVPEQYEKALHAVLGKKAEYLLEEDSSASLAEFIRNSKDNNSKKLLGVIDTDFKNKDENIISEADIPDAVKPLGSIVDVTDENYRSLVNELLKHTYVSENIESAVKLKSELSSRGITDFTIALLTGEVLSAWGWYTTQGEGIQFSFIRRLKELQDVLSGIDTEISHAEEELNSKELLAEDLKNKSQEMNRVRSELHNLQKELSDLFRKENEVEKKHSEKLREEERKLRDELNSIEKQYSHSLREVEQEGMRLNAAINSINEQLKRNNLDFENSLKKEEELQEKHLRLSEEVENVKNTEIRMLENTDSEEHSELRDKITSLEQSIEELEGERVSLQKDLGDIRFEQSEIRRNKESLERGLRNITSSIDRARIELEMIQEDYRNHYPDDESFTLPEFNIAIQTIEQIIDSVDKKISVVSENSHSIRKRLEREGEVDPQSIELYKQEEERLESMTTQISDLKGAKETLERTIRQLKELSRIRFIETFHAVNATFKELIPRLFAGGSGHLELINPEDPLQSGVNIVVRPPGKKITTMELMSGGEKALVATGVLVSVFLHHPGPICVLDEVDAPLDDANLTRFLELIREISDKTQFLVITHNKLTMQAVDRLIGITMQESGVTTALAVDFEEAEEEIEKWTVNA